MLAPYVYNIVHNQQEFIYNSVTKVLLPSTASHDDLVANFCLAGQERLAISHALCMDRKKFSVTVIPTWECNLRCTHCSVLTQLKRVDAQELDVGKLTNFIGAYVHKHKPREVAMHFVGGEPLLKAAKCADVVAATSHLCTNYSITTNGAIPFTSDILKLLEHMSRITVSVDGSEETHNEQRIPLDRGNPYQTTLENVSLLVKQGFVDKLHIQGAVRDEYLTKQHYREFLWTMGLRGVKLDNVVYGCIHPTDKHADSERYETLFTARPIRTPCCKFRLGHVWLIDASGGVYDLPFKWAQTRYGSLDDDLDVILERRRQHILAIFPCLQDDKCLACPAIGFCWGACVTGDPMTGRQPSKYCKQELLVEKVRHGLATGQLPLD